MRIEMEEHSITPRVLRRRSGHFLEDFRPGAVFRHKGGKTVTEGLFALFTEFSMTTNPLAKNARYARAHGFAGLVCPPGLTMLVAFSQTVEDVSENARANLEYRDMRFGVPVYVGDTIEVETAVLEVTPSRRRPDLGVVAVQSTARKNVGAADEAVVLTWQRKVQVWKGAEDALLTPGRVEPRAVDCSLWLPPYRPRGDYRHLAHLSNRDTYFEDFATGTWIEHSRGRTVTDEHIALTAVLDNTSQVHCNQLLIDRDPGRFVGGKLIVFGGIPFVLCLGLSCPDVGDNALGDLVYAEGRHTAPLFAGETVFAATEICHKRPYPEREDLGVLATRLRGYKFEPVGESEAVAPDGDGTPLGSIPGYRRVQIFELARELVVKRRSHYG